MRVAPIVALTPRQASRLRTWRDGWLTNPWLALRADVVLLASFGLENLEIASLLGVTRRTVGRWRAAFVDAGLTALRPSGPSERARAARTRAAPQLQG